jgi:hypothetical protein
MSMRTNVKVAGCGLALLALGLAVPAAEASDIQPFKTVYATDVAYAGLGGMRGIGNGSIALTGVSGTVTEALLFWHGPTNSADPASSAAVSFAGQPVTGTNIGTSASNCWGFDNSQAYRADVTSLVTGDGSYALADFTKTGVDINGAQLVVFFDDGDAANNRDIVMFEGNDSNVSNPFDADGWNVSLPGIQYAGGAASMDMIVSDGQTFTDGSLEINAATLDPGPNLFQGDTVPSAGSNNNGLLWDQRQFDITSQLTPGTNTVTITHSYVDDCLSLVLAAVNLPAGSAPNQPTTTTTAPPAPTTTVAPTTTTTPPVVVVPVRATPRFTG